MSGLPSTISVSFSVSARCRSLRAAKRAQRSSREDATRFSVRTLISPKLSLCDSFSAFCMSKSNSAMVQSNSFPFAYSSQSATLLASGVRCRVSTRVFFWGLNFPPRRILGYNYFMNSGARICQNCKQSFAIEPDDFSFYKKIKVPLPTFCVECREQRRIAFRNERALYRRKCDLCGKIVIARVSPDKPYPMYCQECWWSDKWDPLSFGKTYDFSKPFFEQFRDLLFATPHISLLNTNTVNSEWVNQETDDKNCFLNVGGHFNENSAYNTFELYGKDCFDSYWLLHSELCYECVNCERCYKTFFSKECFDCRDTILSYDCRNCINVFGCAGQRNKQYYIFNEPYSKEQYQAFLRENPVSSHSKLLELQEKADKVWRSTPHKYAFILKSKNVRGNFITESKNALNCWNAEKIEDSKNLYITVGMKDSYDGSTIGWGELCYEGAHCGGNYNSKFFAFVFGGGAGVDKVNSSDLEYCYSTPSCRSCFGCANLKNQEYCILNKKCSKEEYEQLTSKIREQMNKTKWGGADGRIYGYGEFFPIELSSFGYNETVAQEYYPLTREEALRKGYPWSDFEFEAKYEFSDYVIPDDVRDVEDDILEKVLKCEVSEKAYKIMPMDLQFYRRMGLPIPRRAPLQRHKDRMAKLLPRKLFDRSCCCVGKQSSNGIYTNTVSHFHSGEKCPNRFQTPYASNRPEVVYCEQCYQTEVV